VVKRLDKIGQHGSSTGLDECLHGHSGQQLETFQACNFLQGGGDMDEIVRRATLLILDNIARYSDHAAVDFRSGALVKGREAKHCSLADRQLINVLWRQLPL